MAYGNARAWCWWTICIWWSNETSTHLSPLDNAYVHVLNRIKTKIKISPRTCIFGCDFNWMTPSLARITKCQWTNQALRCWLVECVVVANVLGIPELRQGLLPFWRKHAYRVCLAARLFHSMLNVVNQLITRRKKTVWERVNVSASIVTSHPRKQKIYSTFPQINLIKALSYHLFSVLWWLLAIKNTKYVVENERCGFRSTDKTSKLINWTEPSCKHKSSTLRMHKFLRSCCRCIEIEMHVDVKPQQRLISSEMEFSIIEN